MRDYELVYILDPGLSEEAVTELIERFKTLASGQGAEIKSQERWEKRRLAYEIKDKREGVYVVMELKALPEAVQEIDRVLKITEGVLRHLIVRVEEGKSTRVSELRSETRASAETRPSETRPSETTPEPTVEAEAEPDAVDDSVGEGEAVDETEDVPVDVEAVPAETEA